MKRTCKVCGKTLACLNPNKDLCFAHDPKYPQYQHVPVTRCTGYKQMVFEKEGMIEGLLKLPGIDGYNERAFSKILIYPNIG
jgi:hypothetical protein